jgi:hypothetical protein
LGPELQHAGISLSAEVWVVDRIEDGVALLILDDAGAEPVVSEVDAALLGDRAVEGAVLEVPLGGVGEPVWEHAAPLEDERGE